MAAHAGIRSGFPNPLLSVLRYCLLLCDLPDPSGAPAVTANPTFGGGAGGFGGAGLGIAAGAGPAVNKWVPDPTEERYVVSNGVRGSISSLAWFPTELALALTTWDGEVQLLSVQQQQLQVMASYTTGATLAPAGQKAAPILCSVCQGKSVALGSCDGKLRVWTADQGPSAITEWGTHAAPIKKVMALESPAWPTSGYLTGSFDKTLALWPQPSPNGQPSAKMNVGFKVFDMDGIAPYVLIAGSDRHMALMDVRKGSQSVYAGYSPLQWQTRCCVLVAGGGTQEPKGYCVGGVDGSIGALLFSNPEEAKRLQITTPAVSGARRSVNDLGRLPNNPDKVHVTPFTTADPYP